jgi:DNA-binding response OmpR family regulator
MRKVLIVEDDPMVAGLLSEILVEGEYAVCGIARTVAEAVALVRLNSPDLAVIDLRLADGGLGTEVAAELGARGALGILYTTGATHVVLTVKDGHARLAKPYRDTDLLRGLEIVAGMVSTGTASPPFPSGFQLLPAATAARP